MKLKRIISGGQTGADRTALECAQQLNIETGGTAPKGYRTETGPDPRLKDFGLIEHSSTSYAPRTRKNVRDSDCTVWFGNTGSPGYKCTKKACDDYNKPLFCNIHNFNWISDWFEIINIAGNRASTNPSVINQVKKAFESLK